MKSKENKLTNIAKTRHYAQAFQSIAIGTILIVGGKFGGYIHMPWGFILITILLCIGLEYFSHRKTGFPFSALNSSIGICLFLRSSNLFVYVFAAAFAIFSKQIFTSKGKHFLNPSYTAIFLAVALLPQIAFVNPLQWQGHALPILGIILLGIFVQSQVKFFDGILSFILSFILLFFTLTRGSIDEFYTLVLTGSFFIVALFGFTDPATTPKKSIDRILFMIQISVLFFFLRFWINENYALFAAYLITQLCEPFYRNARHRTQTQAATLILSFMLTLGQTWIFTTENNSILPNILNNRCNQLLCK